MSEVERGATLRACHIIHSLGRGGAESVLLELARVAPAAGLELSVVSLMPLPPEGSLAPELRAAGTSVVSLDLADRWDPRAFLRAQHIITQVAPDIVHTHLKHADLVGGVVAARKRLPHVSTLHVVEDAVGGLGRAKRLAASVLRRQAAAATIAVSEAQRQWYLGLTGAPPDSVVTMYNGVSRAEPLDDERRTALRNEAGARDDSVLVLMVAIMRPGKGHEDLFQAIDALADDDGVVFALAGDGPERAHLEGLAARRPKVRRRVRFLGYRDDVQEVISAADLVVHPTHADALPTALIQAQAAGVPTIASDVGGVPEVVVEGTGRLVPPRSPSALARALEELIGDAAARDAMGRAARTHFDAAFASDVWVRNLMALYRSL